MLLCASLHPGVPAGVYFLKPLFFLRQNAVSSAIYINPSLIIRSFMRRGTLRYSRELIGPVKPQALPDFNKLNRLIC